MRKLHGFPLNINHTIVGRITHKPIACFNKKDLVIVSNKKNLPKGYVAVVTNLPSKDIINIKRIPVLCNVSEINQLKDGDIVLLEKDGMVNLLYERNSFDNSLMLTERCNCSCIMCPQTPVSVEDDKTLFNIKLISLMDKKTPCLGLTGGEPTLIGDKLFDIIYTCKKRLPRTELTLLTNGIRFENFEYVRKLAMIRCSNLLIDIPLYSDTDTEHNTIVRTKSFYKTIKGLYNLALFKQKVGIRIVVIKPNYRRLPELAEFIYHNFPFVFHIAFMQMETIGLAKDNIENLWIDPFDYNKELDKAVMYLAQRDMNVSIYNAQLCILPKDLWKYARKSISSWKNIYITECSDCDYRGQCGGFFESSFDKHSRHIKPIKST